MNILKPIKPLCFSAFVLMPVIVAANANEDTAEEEEENIVVVGSRGAPRSVGDSPVPIDVISQEEFKMNASTDMTSLLTTVVPSFVVNEQPISDAATLVKPANLRGLPPDSTLILVNGKRRHRSAVIAFLGGGISDGSQGPDISVIPNIAIKQVEVLRDGAAAQYGSDAIAGVINFELKDNAEGVELESRFGQYFEGDGNQVIHSMNVGLPLMGDGFTNLSIEVKNQDTTNRSTQRGDAADLIAAGNTQVADPAQIWGSPEIKDDIKFFGNMATSIGDSGEIYLFGNWAQREVDGGFYFRNPLTRSGVFSNDDGVSLLVGDLDPKDNVDCSAFNVGTLKLNGDPVLSGDSPARADAAALNAVLNESGCFVFNSLFPGGFTPRFGGTVKDSSLALGYTDELDNGIIYDVSINTGQNDVNFYIRNTVNASLGPNSPTSFNPGRYKQTETNFNLSGSYPVDIGSWASPLNVAAGIEVREESFEIFAGDPASFEVGPLASQGFGIGSNGFPGFKTEDAGKFDRQNSAIFVDIEGKPVESFHWGFALRFEDYDDFGSTTNGKLTGRLQINDVLAARTSFSTGFRAPTVGQANVRNVTTAFSGGSLRDEATLPPTNPISVELGGELLQPEESTSYTLGSVYQDGDFYLTVDYFNIEVTDRISQTSPIDLTQENIDALVAQGIEDALSYSAIKFFTNDFDTTTQGVDLIANYSLPMWQGETRFGLALNWTKTEVDRFSSIINSTKLRQLEDNVPNMRGTLTINHQMDYVSAMVRMNYFGDYFEPHLDDDTLPIDAGAEFTIDVEASYDVANYLTIALGARNLLDEYPDDNPYALIAGAQYPTTSPMGFNGGFYYTRFSLYL